MSRLDELIAEFCPEGVPFRAVGDVTAKGANIKWANAGDEEFQYIDLSSVDRGTRKIDDTATISAKDAPSRAQQIVQTGDVIFATTRPTQMRWAMIPSEYDGQIASTGYCVLRPDTSTVLANFLAHLLGADAFRQYIKVNQVEGNYPSIPDSRVRKYRIPVPPLEVQHKIVRILGRFAKLESELEAALYAELEARVFQYNYLMQSVVSDIQATKVPLRQLGEWRGGVTPSKSNPRYWDEGSIPWLASMDVSESEGKAIRGRVTPDAIAETSLRLIPSPSVVTVMRSNILRRRLPVGLVEVDTTVNQDIRALIPRDGIEADYVYQVLRSTSETIRRAVVRTDGSMAAVNSNAFLDWTIPVPPVDEQRRIAAQLRELDTVSKDLRGALTCELASRRKQYGHYRDRLLTFEEATS